MDENIGYNGAYTGSQIDAAIGAVRDKETTWDGKQDKLTGVQGQVVGFDDEGDAVAMPAPDTGVTTFNGRTGAVTPQAGDYTAAMVGARADNWMPTADEVGAVPVGRTVNGKPLNADITLGAGDVGAVPTTTTVNGKSLSGNISLTADDVGARPNTWTPTADDVGAIPASQKGANNGIAELDSTGRVPSTQLPSYVDDVLEYASFSNFPQTGEDGKIYIAEDTNRQYRWSGSQYVEISPSLALGETSSTAYRGDRGAIAYTHSQTTGNPHNTTAAEVGAVPTSRTVNGHALSDNISLTADDVGARSTNWTPTAADVGAVPTNRTVNGKALSANIELTAEDVDALPTSGGTLTGALVLPGEPTSANQAANKAYVDNAVPSVITVSTNTTVATSAWSSNSTYSAYPYRASVAVANVTVNHFPSIVFNPNDADFSKLAPVCETYAGGIYIYASEIPSATVNILSMMFTAQS